MVSVESEQSWLTLHSFYLLHQLLNILLLFLEIAAEIIHSRVHSLACRSFFRISLILCLEDGKLTHAARVVNAALTGLHEVIDGFIWLKSKGKIGLFCFPSFKGKFDGVVHFPESCSCQGKLLQSWLEAGLVGGMPCVFRFALEVSLDGAHQVAPVHLAIFAGLSITAASDKDHTGLIDLKIQNVSAFQSISGGF